MQMHGSGAAEAEICGGTVIHKGMEEIPGSQKGGREGRLGVSLL